MKVYVVTFQTEQGDKRVGAVYATLEEAKLEAARLCEANSWTSAGVLIRNVEVEVQLTPEQRRWLIGYGTV